MSSKLLMDTTKCIRGQLLLSQVRKLRRTQVLLLEIRCFSAAGFDTVIREELMFIFIYLIHLQDKHMTNGLVFN